MAPADVVGWAASAVLIATLGRQIFTQWREQSTQGMSHWFFIGQVIASVGFVVYSWMVGNWVFVFTNAAILLTALAGQWVSVRNARLKERKFVFSSRSEMSRARSSRRWLRKLTH